ncbi:multidrug effflux MFS transporter [Pelagovum pacificum]|uniref:Bcr/CflA family efflux transporter n=1 Tax=Pelagovum pacificum TaxID=2588711 RepID=A0A5C5GDJ7_9RHOB|nr:multidrug effflux MFS transporter [Pelagovum pacificum]QQA44785.1 multidrug effflux MFS transporter [Pelagovum pacificum]TNY32107.1 multidrug effflux MFS transporter [Pelagovum pacificum]
MKDSAPSSIDDRRRLREPEFIALMAMSSAVVAFSVDAMLPALPSIADELTPDAPNRAQLIVTAFIFGMGLGTLVAGPLSDRFGRKPVYLGGIALYITGAILAWSAPTLELMLAARLVQGLGAAGPRVVFMAMIRDLYAGRAMARILSFVMMFFTLIPALAPLLGNTIIELFGWRATFVAFVVFAMTAMSWMFLRQPETLPPERRAPVSPKALLSALKEIFSTQTALLATVVQTFIFGMLFSNISSTQMIFDQTYGYGDTFHLWFGGLAILAASGNVLNAQVVVKTGMRALIRWAMMGQIFFSTAMILVLWLPLPASVEFPLFLIWTWSLFFQMGLTIGNLNALALEPLGHISGSASALISAVSTIGSVIIGATVGLAFNGTPLPLALATLTLSSLSLFLTTKIKRDSDPD